MCVRVRVCVRACDSGMFFSTSTGYLFLASGSDYLQCAVRIVKLRFHQPIAVKTVSQSCAVQFCFVLVTVLHYRCEKPVPQPSRRVSLVKLLTPVCPGCPDGPLNIACCEEEKFQRQGLASLFEV